MRMGTLIRQRNPDWSAAGQSFRNTYFLLERGIRRTKEKAAGNGRFPREPPPWWTTHLERKLDSSFFLFARCSKTSDNEFEIEAGTMFVGVEGTGSMRI